MPAKPASAVRTTQLRYATIAEQIQEHGWKVLPGFTLPLIELVAAPARPKRKGR
jgi:hypothetical protein